MSKSELKRLSAQKPRVIAKSTQAEEIGRWYIVTKASDEGTFEVGDHISINTDGSINCRETRGRVEKCDVPKATAGMIVEIDHEGERNE